MNARGFAKELIQNVNEISVVSPEKFDLYYRFFSQDRLKSKYANSIFYITQACRGLGYGLKFCDEDVLISIGVHRSHFVLVNPLGDYDRRLAGLLRYLSDVSQKPVFIKKMIPSPGLLNDIGDDIMEANSPLMHIRQQKWAQLIWSKRAPEDDDTFPECLIDINLTLSYRLSPKEWLESFLSEINLRLDVYEQASIKKKYRNFRRKVFLFERSKFQITLQPYSSKDYHELKEFIQSYFKDPMDFSAYQNMLRIDENNLSGSRDMRFIVRLKGEISIKGFLCLSRIDQDTAGLYANVISRFPSGLPEYSRIYLMEYLRNEGIRYINLGGSELHSLYDYKLKMGPVEKRKMPLYLYHKQ